MATGKIKSNTADVQEAVAELTGLQVSNFQTVKLGKSNVTSMKNGTPMANELPGNVSKGVSCVLEQANKFPKLAQRTEEDEAHVKAMLANTNQLITLVEQKMRDDKDLIKSFMKKELTGAIPGISELLGIKGHNLKSLKYAYEKQLEAIQTFSFSTNSFFTDFRNVMYH
jgi:hypothetical protein